MTQDQADRIEGMLKELLDIFKTQSPGEVRRKAKSDVLRYLQRHQNGVKEGHGGEVKVER